jgi:hypothetical protein
LIHTKFAVIKHAPLLLIPLLIMQTLRLQVLRIRHSLAMSLLCMMKEMGQVLMWCLWTHVLATSLLVQARTDIQALITRTRTAFPK